MAEKSWIDHHLSTDLFDCFADELRHIKTAVAIIKNPADTLDRRTSRHYRKPNPRIMPAPMPSGKLVV